MGDAATFYHKETQIGTLPSLFTHREFCVPQTDVDVSNDEFKIVAGGNDGVS